MRRPLLIGALLLLTVACAGLFQLRSSAAFDVEELDRLSSAVTKLSAAVETTVRYESPPADAADEQLLALSTAQDGALLTPFGAYRLRVKQQDRHAVVLVCTKDGKQALLEDVGCTGKLDAAPYRNPVATACDFTVPLSEACRLPPGPVDAGL